MSQISQWPVRPWWREAWNCMGVTRSERQSASREPNAGLAVRHQSQCRLHLNHLAIGSPSLYNLAPLFSFVLWLKQHFTHGLFGTLWNVNMASAYFGPCGLIIVLLLSVFCVHRWYNVMRNYLNVLGIALIRVIGVIGNGSKRLRNTVNSNIIPYHMPC